MTTSPVVADDGFEALTRKIAADRGFACASYKEKCLRRRVAVRMRARGVHTYEEYARLLDGDASEYDRLIDALTINVTRFFRNPEVWDAVARQVIPVLWERPGPIRGWSAGSSSGEEACTLSVLFHEHARREGALGDLARVSILGTDIDERSLAAARAALYVDRDFIDVPQDLRARYFAPTPPYSPVQAVRALTSFQRDDLLADDGDGRQYDLIVCRNVLIYFDRATQERVFTRFHRQLAPGGMLVLGKVETLIGDARQLFHPVDSRERIFRHR